MFCHPRSFCKVLRVTMKRSIRAPNSAIVGTPRVLLFIWTGMIHPNLFLRRSVSGGRRRQGLQPQLLQYQFVSGEGQRLRESIQGEVVDGIQVISSL